MAVQVVALVLNGLCRLCYQQLDLDSPTRRGAWKATTDPWKSLQSLEYSVRLVAERSRDASPTGLTPGGGLGRPGAKR